MIKDGTTCYLRHQQNHHVNFTGELVGANVELNVYCQECDLILCTDGCYRLFHTKWDYLGAKGHISEEYGCEIESDRKMQKKL